MENNTKLCPKCDQHLPYDAFHKHKGKGKLGLKSWCKVCDNAKMAELRRTNPEWVEKREKTKKEWYREHIEEQRRKARERDSTEEGKLKSANRMYKRKYGLTLEQVEELRNKQNNRCAICSKDFKKGWDSAGFCVDHDHETGQVRALLCRICNLGIGLLQDCPDIVSKAAEYLAKHKQ